MSGATRTLTSRETLDLGLAVRAAWQECVARSAGEDASPYWLGMAASFAHLMTLLDDTESVTLTAWDEPSSSAAWHAAQTSDEGRQIVDAASSAGTVQP